MDMRLLSDTELAKIRENLETFNLNGVSETIIELLLDHIAALTESRQKPAPQPQPKQGEFKVGDRVKFGLTAWGKYDNEGQYGTIVRRNRPGAAYKWTVKVDFPGTQSDELGFNDDELELIESEDQS